MAASVLVAERGGDGPGTDLCIVASSEDRGVQRGFKFVESCTLVRSSYTAWNHRVESPTIEKEVGDRP